MTASVSGEHARRRLEAGLSLVELLVVVAVVGVILASVAAFFTLQTRVARETQAQNELQVRMRAVAEAVAQDLQLAGARAMTDSAGSARAVTAVLANCNSLPDGAQYACARVDVDEDSGDVTSATFVYASSLRVAPAETVASPDALARVCRVIRYERVTDETAADFGALYRSDERCLDAAGALVPTPANLFARDVVGLEVLFACGVERPVGAVAVPDDLKTDTTECFELEGGFVREGIVEITGRSSDARVARQEYTVRLSAAMPNLRRPPGSQE